MCFSEGSETCCCCWVRGGCVRENGWGEGGNGYLFEKSVVGLFGGADFDRFRHFAGGDDDAAEGFWGGAGHCLGFGGRGALSGVFGGGRVGEYR